MLDNRPVIIVGAPRSGTSLMQKLIREAPGFVSVPKESDMIWLPHCHPATNDWKYEGCPDSRITPELTGRIRADFHNQALSASTWRLFDRLGLMERPRMAAVLRLGYRLLFKPWKRIRETSNTPRAETGRLVDKSVHAGLWLNLVDSVFPDAMYIHMVRSPEACVPSMIQGWRMSSRFRTYKIPSSLLQPGDDQSGLWSFPMPPGWEQHYDKDLVDICTFQWLAINTSILEYLSAPPFTGRVLRIHLEDLADKPAYTLDMLCRFLNMQTDSFKKYRSHLPPVNASPTSTSSDTASLDTIRQQTLDLYNILKQAEGSHLLAEL